MTSQKRKWMENATTSFKEAAGFDRRFWKKAGAQARFVAMWKMVIDFVILRGGNGRLPRLRRSVQKIKRS